MKQGKKNVSIEFEYKELFLDQKFVHLRKLLGTLRTNKLFCCLVYSFSINFCFRVTARGFGMRVVGGKTGADGRLFAYIVWTVPGGPAEKGGLQQGDKVSDDTPYKNTVENSYKVIDSTYYITKLRLCVSMTKRLST